MALPITISGATFSAPNGGPFKSSTSFYIAALGSTTTIDVWKADSDSPTTGWTAQDTTANPSASAIGSMHSHLDGTTIHIVSQETSAGGADVEYHTYGTSGDAWSVTNESVTTVPDDGSEFCSISVRSDGDVIAVYDGETEKNMGTPYNRVDLARRETGTWTADISIDNLGKTETNMRYPFVVRGDATNDRMHIFYQDFSTPDFYYSTYLSGNTWGHQHSLADTTVTAEPHSYQAVAFDDGGTTKVRAFYEDADAELSVVGFDDADDPGTSISIATSITTTSLLQTVAPAVNGDVQHVLAEANNASIVHHETGAGDDTWGSANSELSSLTAADVFSANVYDNSGTKLAYLYLDGSNYGYNERALASFAPDLQGWRFYDDDGGEAASTALELNDTNTDVDVDAGNVDLQLRIMVQESGGLAGAATDDYQLQVSHEGGAYANVTGASTYVIATTAGLTNNSATTNRASSPLDDGTGTFVAGEQSSDGLVDDLSLTASNFTELAYGLRVVAADVSNLDTLDFQLSTPTGIVNTVTPRITVSKTPTGIGIPIAAHHYKMLRAS